jgi:hypothetical protein
MDWLEKVIFDNTGQENTRASDKELASAIREEIRKRRPEHTEQTEHTWNFGLSIRNKTISDYDKALGLEEGKNG